MPATCGRTRLQSAPFACLRLSETRGSVKEFSGFPSALTVHGTFVRVNFGVISVRARRRPRCGKEDLHALRRDVIRSRRCTGCIVPLRGVRMEGSGLSLGKSRGRSRSDLGSSRVRGLRRGRFHRDGFSPSRLFFPCSVSPCVGRTHFSFAPLRRGGRRKLGGRRRMPCIPDGPNASFRPGGGRGMHISRAGVPHSTNLFHEMTRAEDVSLRDWESEVG